ncbi:MAG: SDR family NAD(P)-dependent oxidoreductase [Hyphomicrobiaceae bacterium]
MMTGMLEGKAALITGGARGIGRAAANLFAREGASVAVSDISIDGASETVATIATSGGHAISVPGDVTSADDVASMVDATVRAFGRLDCAFNNAGIAPYQVNSAGQNTAEWTEEAFDRMIGVNLKGVWLCMRAQIQHMLAHGGGAIVNTASIAGLIGIRTSSAYTAAKHGVVGLTKTAGIEYAQNGIRVNSICPGFIETDMTKVTMRNRGDEILRMIPTRKLGTAHEVAELVCWLCSDRSSYVNGANIPIDSAYTAQ